MIRMRLMVGGPSTQGKATAFRMIGDAHILLGRLLWEGRLIDDSDLVTIQSFVQIVISVGI